jgi:hypothetical protein
MSRPIKTQFRKEYNNSLLAKAPPPKAEMGKVGVKHTQKWELGQAIKACQPYPFAASLLSTHRLILARDGQEPPETIEEKVSEPFLEPTPKWGFYIANGPQSSSSDGQLPADRQQLGESSSIMCVDLLDDQ